MHVTGAWIVCILHRSGAWNWCIGLRSRVTTPVVYAAVIARQSVDSPCNLSPVPFLMERVINGHPAGNGHPVLLSTKYEDKKGAGGGGWVIL